MAAEAHFGKLFGHRNADSLCHNLGQNRSRILPKLRYFGFGNVFYVLLAHFIYAMESGRFSQSPTFLKRAVLLDNLHRDSDRTAILRQRF